MSYVEDQRPSRGLQILGWVVFVIALPLALLGSIADPNEYKAIFGGNGLDCDGPFGVYLLAYPALAIYGIALVVNALRWRRTVNLIAALLSLMICIALAVNVARAMTEEREQAEACAAR